MIIQGIQLLTTTIQRVNCEVVYIQAVCSKNNSKRSKNIENVML